MIRFVKMAGRFLYSLMPDDTPQEAQDLAKAGVIYAPSGFLNCNDEQLQAICNGCGAANAKFDFVPDSIWFLYIGYACQIHDYMYHTGKTNEDKEEADRVFLHNLLRIIDRDVSWWRSKKKMKKIAHGYYLGVKHFGGPAFWVGKNQ